MCRQTTEPKLQSDFLHILESRASMTIGIKMKRELPEKRTFHLSLELKTVYSFLWSFQYYGTVVSAMAPDHAMRHDHGQQC